MTWPELCLRGFTHRVRVLSRGDEGEREKVLSEAVWLSLLACDLAIFGEAE